MARDMKMSDMDKVMDALESGKVAKREKASVGQALKMYYPKLNELRLKKGYTVADVYRVFREMCPEMETTKAAFTTYWYRARAAHEKATAQGKPVQAMEPVSENGKTANPGRGGDALSQNGGETAGAKTVESPAKPLEQPVNRTVEQKPQPVQAKPVQAQAKPTEQKPDRSFMTDDKVKERNEEIKRILAEKNRTENMPC